MHSTATYTSCFSHHKGGDVGNLFVSTSQPSAVTTRVCSNCAERLPSAVTAVQPSGHVTSRYVPKLTMGSIVKVWPSLMMPTACTNPCPVTVGHPKHVCLFPITNGRQPLRRQGSAQHLVVGIVGDVGRAVEKVSNAMPTI